MTAEEQTADAISKDDALQMLQFHSLIHETKALGYALVMLSGGATVTTQLITRYDIGTEPILIAALALALLGAVVWFLVPKYLLRRVRGGSDR